MRQSPLIIVLATMLLLDITVSSPASAGDSVEPAGRPLDRVNVTGANRQSEDGARFPSVSADGRYVAFSSYASDLVPGDTNQTEDVFVRDRVRRTTTRVSVASDGGQTNPFSLSESPAISADGRYVAFHSDARNLVPDDGNYTGDVFFHDRRTGTTTRISRAVRGVDADGYSAVPTMSADARYIAFYSGAANLVPGDTNGFWDAFVFDRRTGQTTRVSVGVDGRQPDENSITPAISGNGRYVAFTSWATNLVPGDTNATGDAFVYDRSTGTTRRVSVSRTGVQGNQQSHPPRISATGRYVAFGSYATNLVPGDTNGTADVFLRDLQTGALTRISATPTGGQSNGPSLEVSISADGRYIAYGSEASNLVPRDTNHVADILVQDRRSRSTTRVSVSARGVQGNSFSFNPTISANGQCVVFVSAASNLVPGDTNDKWDGFARCRA